MDSERSRQTVIELCDVAKSFGTGERATQVLDGIDLEITQGECVFLLGPSGCGKTTLLSIIGCILQPDHGTVRILGQVVSTLDEHDQANFRREHVGFIFQRFHLLRGLTAKENVCVPLLLSGWKESDAAGRSVELLTAVGLRHRLYTPAQCLSGGESQRVAIARALACDPLLILADEPTASLDAESGRIVMQLLGELATAYHKTVIVVTHDERITPFADRVYHMRDGQIARSGSPCELAVGAMP